MLGWQVNERKVPSASLGQLSQHQLRRGGLQPAGEVPVLQIQGRLEHGGLVSQISPKRSHFWRGRKVTNKCGKGVSGGYLQTPGNTIRHHKWGCTNPPNCGCPLSRIPRVWWKIWSLLFLFWRSQTCQHTKKGLPSQRHSKCYF